MANEKSKLMTGFFLSALTHTHTSSGTRVPRHVGWPRMQFPLTFVVCVGFVFVFQLSGIAKA